MATVNNNLSFHNLAMEDATELALERPLWRFWQQMELRSEMMQTEQWWWWWFSVKKLLLLAFYPLIVSFEKSLELLEIDLVCFRCLSGCLRQGEKDWKTEV